jgi:hypothetical protein
MRTDEGNDGEEDDKDDTAQNIQPDPLSRLPCAALSSGVAPARSTGYGGSAVLALLTGRGGRLADLVHAGRARSATRRTVLLVAPFRPGRAVRAGTRDTPLGGVGSIVVRSNGGVSLLLSSGGGLREQSRGQSEEREVKKGDMRDEE